MKDREVSFYEHLVDGAWRDRSFRGIESAVQEIELEIKKVLSNENLNLQHKDEILTVIYGKFLSYEPDFGLYLTQEALLYVCNKKV